MVGMMAEKKVGRKDDQWAVLMVASLVLLRVEKMAARMVA